MQDISLFDDNFSVNHSSSYYLLLQVGLNNFSYCILDELSNKFLAIRNINFENKLTDDSLGKKLNEIIISDDKLCHQFKKTKVIYSSPRSTLIPSSLFDEGKINPIFFFNFENAGKEEIFYYHVPGNDLFILYSVPLNIRQIFSEWFNNIRFFHQSCPFISQQLKTTKNENNKMVFADVNKAFVDILVADSSSLQFFNSFNYNSEDDFVYFIANVYDKLKLNPGQVEIILSGDIEKNDNNYMKLEDYLKNISFFRQFEGMNFSYKFDEINLFSYLNLFNLSKCE